MRTMPTVASLTALLCVLCALAAPVSAGFGMPEALTPRGALVVDLYDIITILGIIMFLIVFAWLAIVVLRFREGSGHGRSTHEKERHNGKAEALWIGIPLILVMWIGYAAYGGMVDLERSVAPADADMEIRIVGSQWNWEAVYDGGVSVFANPDSANGAVADANVFYVPADKDILLNITSVDVIHAFNILDGNHGWFSMNDANPLGSNKYALQVLNFPAGNYSVQCKEMCHNPGHAYMRARFVAVPQAQYDAWHAEAKLAVGATLTQTYDVVASGGKLTTSGDLTVVSGTRAILRVHNQDTSASVTLTGPGPTVAIAPGTTGLAAFDFATPGNYTVSGSNGGKLAFTAIAAEVINVELGAFKLIPGEINVTPGVTYLIQVKNTHSTAHNLFIGNFAEGKKLASSPTINGGDSASFVWTATADAPDMWCDVPGHHGLGMHGTVV